MPARAAAPGNRRRPRRACASSKPTCSGRCTSSRWRRRGESDPCSPAAPARRAARVRHPMHLKFVAGALVGLAVLASSATAISYQGERELGQQFDLAARQRAPIIDDPDVVAYVNSIGKHDRRDAGRLVLRRISSRSFATRASTPSPSRAATSTCTAGCSRRCTTTTSWRRCSATRSATCTPTTSSASRRRRRCSTTPRCSACCSSVVQPAVGSLATAASQAAALQYTARVRAGGGLPRRALHAGGRLRPARHARFLQEAERSAAGLAEVGAAVSADPPDDRRAPQPTRGGAEDARSGRPHQRPPAELRPAARAGAGARRQRAAGRRPDRVSPVARCEPRQSERAVPVRHRRARNGPARRGRAPRSRPREAGQSTVSSASSAASPCASAIAAKRAAGSPTTWRAIPTTPARRSISPRRMRRSATPPAREGAYQRALAIAPGLEAAQHGYGHARRARRPRRRRLLPPRHRRPPRRRLRHRPQPVRARRRRSFPTATPARRSGELGGGVECVPEGEAAGAEDERRRLNDEGAFRLRHPLP